MAGEAAAAGTADQLRAWGEPDLATAVWAASRSTCSRMPATMACSRCGTARSRRGPQHGCLQACQRRGNIQHGGVLVVAGDVGAKSSSLPHQSDHIFIAMIEDEVRPGCGNSSISASWLGDVTIFRLLGVGMKAIADTVDLIGRVCRCAPHRTVLPTIRHCRRLSIRWPDQPLEQEMRLQHYKVYAAMAYARANRLNTVVIDGPRARQRHHLRQGRSTSGRRSTRDRRAGRDRAACKIGMTAARSRGRAPLRRRARGDLVVEEKREVIVGARPAV